MKQARKRLLSMILACVMLLSLMPATALAEELDETGESSTSKTVTIYPPQTPLPSLPNELQQVEYIESTSDGQQWIDLGFSPSSYDGLLKSEIDLQYTVLPTSVHALSGVGQSSGYYWIYGVNTSKKFVTQSGANKTETVWGPADRDRHIFMIDQATKTTALDDDTQTMNVSSLSSITTHVALFKGDYRTPFYTVVKLYSASFSYWDVESETYIPLRDMVPCYVKEGEMIETSSGKTADSGTVGLYDRVEDKFYANANTAEDAAAFKKGSDVINFTEITEPLTVTLHQTTMAYTGTALKPDVTVKSGEAEVLTEDEDYTVTYTNNTDIGTGTVDVQMIPAYGSRFVRMSFTITARTDIYYQDQETNDTSRLSAYIKDGNLYMFLPATANYESLKLYLPAGAVLTDSVSGESITVGDDNNGKLDMTVLFGSNMEPGKEYPLTVTISGQTYNMVLIQSANIPALYITMEELVNSKTNDTVTEGDPSTWLDDYINQSKDWKATEGSVLMVNADGTTVEAGLDSLKGRGSGSWSHGGKKKPYNIKLGSKKELVPGAGKAKKWCLISNYMDLSTHDSTGLANSTAYWLYDEIGGEAAMQYQQVDLYVNGEYRGTYSLTEKVEINKERVDITETEYGTEEGTSTKVTAQADPAIAAGIQNYYYSDGTTLANQTSGGGFLLELNSYYDEVCKFTTRQGVKFTLKEPEYATQEQVQQIAIYVQEFEDALFSDTGYNSQGKHYSEYVDLESLAKKLIVDAFMGNGDSMKNSGYFHIDATTDATTSDEGGALQVNFSGKMLAGPAWDYDYWTSFTDTQNLWTNNDVHGRVWQEKLLEKGDFMDVLYQLNKTSFKGALADGSEMLSALVKKLTPSKTMEYVLLGNDFAAKSTETITKYTNRLAAWNSTVWNSSRLMGVTVECTGGTLTANVNGTAETYQWYQLDENHNATPVDDATEATYTPLGTGEYQVKVTGVSMEPLLSKKITMYSAPITVKSDSYTLTLNTCGGTLPEGAEGTVTVTGETYPVLPTPTKAGCYFLGWFTRPQGGTQITAGGATPTYGADTTIYAQWKTTKTVQDIDDVTGVAMTSDSGSVTWEHEGESAPLTGLILYGNSETGTQPSAELSVPRLPAGYQEVAYIESTSRGQQWIDLDFSPSAYPNQLKSEIDLQYTVLPASGAQGLGGAHTNGSSYYLIYGAASKTGEAFFKMQSGGNATEVTWSHSDTNRHVFAMDQTAGTATLDSSSKPLSVSTEGVTTTVTLFKLNGTRSNPHYSVMRLYSARFSHWDAASETYIPLRDMVPCYKIATGQAGLYDLVNHVFYTNANTGSTANFGAGSDVYTAGAGAVTVTSPVALYAFNGVRDSYNAVTGMVTRRVKVENGTAVAALPEAKWTTEQYTAAAPTQSVGLNRAAYTDSYAAPITVVYVPASVTLSESEFTYNGSEQKPDVTVTVNGTNLTEGADYTITWPADVTNAGEKQISITINNENYNGTLIRTYTVAAPGKEATPAATFTATGPDTGTLSGVSAGMQYSTNGTDWTNIDSDADINLTGLSACTISVVKKGNGSTTVDSDAQEIAVTKAEMPNLTATQPSTIGGKGSIPTTEAHEFSSTSAASGFSPCTGAAENLDPGTYYVRVKASGATLASAAQAIVINAKRTYTGGSGPATYTVYAPVDVMGGAVSVSPKNAPKGSTVTITVKPGEGYKLDSLTAADKDGNGIKLTDNGNGKYTFIMPASKVSIESAFVKIEQSGVNPFTDVKESSHYYDAVLWAVENGITEGTTATTFRPNAACTRAQIVTFLWRAAGSPAPRSNDNPFTDVKVESYYYNAVLWAVEQGITNGTSDDAFSPDAVCTRAQTVTFLYRAAGTPDVDALNIFADVRADAYYANAVSWAVKRGITNGTGSNAFSPNANCTRGQIVTFLYRAAQ